MSLLHWPNVSPSFAAFQAEAEPTDTREAIVVFRTDPPSPNPRGRLRELKERLAAIRSKARAAKPLVDKLASEYQAAAVRHQAAAKSLGLSVRPVAGAKLPVAVVTVTKETLPALAEQSDVAAILPN